MSSSHGLLVGDCERKIPALERGDIMPKNPPTCPKCRKPKHLVPVKIGGRKFLCLDCSGRDPMRSPEIARLLSGELRPLKNGPPSPR